MSNLKLQMSQKDLENLNDEKHDIDCYSAQKLLQVLFGRLCLEGTLYS